MHKEVVLLAGLFKMATCYETDCIRPVYCIKKHLQCVIRYCRKTSTVCFYPSRVRKGNSFDSGVFQLRGLHVKVCSFSDH